MVRLQKFSLSFFIFGLIIGLFACKNTQLPDASEPLLINLTDLTKEEKQVLTARLIKEVNNKKPFQGSLRHGYKCDSLIALNQHVLTALQEKSTPHTKIGNYHLAFPLLEQSVTLNPSEALYYYSWLLLYYFRDYERALTRLNEFDDLTPNKPDVAWGENVNYLKGIAYKQLHKYEDSIQEFSKAIKDDGANVELYAYIYRGIAYLNNHQLELAIQDFDHVILQDANNATAYYWKGRVLLKKTENTQALQVLEKSLELIKKGYFKTDPYMELFDVPSKEQIEDTIAETNLSP